MSVLADESVAWYRFCVFEARVLLVRRVGRARGPLGIMPGQRTRSYFRAPTPCMSGSGSAAPAGTARNSVVPPAGRNRYMIRYTRTQHRPPSRQVNDHGRVSGTQRDTSSRAASPGRHWFGSGIAWRNKYTTPALSSARVRCRPRVTKHELATPANPMAGLWPASVGLGLPISNTGAHTDIRQFQYFPRSKTRADSSGRRNTLMWRCVMGRQPGWLVTQTGRPAMRSPGRPPIRRDVERAFWVKIAEGLTSEGPRKYRVRGVGSRRIALVPRAWGNANSRAGSVDGALPVLQ